MAHGKLREVGAQAAPTSPLSHLTRSRHGVPGWFVAAPASRAGHGLRPGHLRSDRVEPVAGPHLDDHVGLRDGRFLRPFRADPPAFRAALLALVRCARAVDRPVDRAGARLSADLPVCALPVQDVAVPQPPGAGDRRGVSGLPGHAQRQPERFPRGLAPAASVGLRPLRPADRPAARDLDLPGALPDGQRRFQRHLPDVRHVHHGLQAGRLPPPRWRHRGGDRGRLDAAGALRALSGGHAWHALSVCRATLSVAGRFAGERRARCC